MKSLAAKVSLALFLAVGVAEAAVIDETISRPGQGMGAPAGAGMGSAMLGANADRAMRTAVSLNAIQTAFDDSDPRSNIVRFHYDARMTYKLRMREYMSTTVVLPKGETIAGYNLTDSKNFSWMPYSEKVKRADKTDVLENVFTVNVVYPGADTNLVVFGSSGRIYSFYLRADSVKSPHLPHLVAYIEDNPQLIIKPGENKNPAIAPTNESDGKPPSSGIEVSKVKLTGEEADEEAEYLRSIPVANPGNINNAYKIAGGDKTLAPIKVFDDGYWTYFKFSNDKTLDKVRRLPVAYRVVDGYDTPVTTRIEGGTLIAETVGTGWTLRSGEAHVCVRTK